MSERVGRRKQDLRVSQEFRNGKQIVIAHLAFHGIASGSKVPWRDTKGLITLGEINPSIFSFAKIGGAGMISPIDLLNFLRERKKIICTEECETRFPMPTFRRTR